MQLNKWSHGGSEKGNTIVSEISVTQKEVRFLATVAVVIMGLTWLSVGVRK